MATNYTETNLVNAGTLAKMFRRFAELMSNPSAVKPHRNSETGRYDNLGEWLALLKDGKVYGVKQPRYAYSPVTTATNTGANAGLVLEASTELAPGRNDYDGRALFVCVRVNGGVDTDGTHYVTAIEGYDDYFDETENTYALTLPYYRKESFDTNFRTLEISDSPQTGFKACRGMYTSAGVKRDFLLRACFLDSGGNFSSKSGTMPAAYSSAYPTSVNHSMSNDFSASKSRAATDGLTYLDYGDLQWQHDFMEIMMGVKSPRSVAVGCVDYNVSATVTTVEESVKRVIVSTTDAAKFVIGSTVDVGSSNDRSAATCGSIVKCAKILSKTTIDANNVALNLDISTAVDIVEGTKVTTMAWKNGSCDKVLGTFGSPSAAGLTNGKEPFKFQNVEWQLGLYETCFDLLASSVVEDSTTTVTWYVAPDCSACTGGIDKGVGWTALDTQTVGTKNSWNYIKEHKGEKGAVVPENVGGSSSTGYKTAIYLANATGNNEALVGGHLYYGAHAGVGCMSASNAVSYASWCIAGRSSGLGHSAPAE